MSIALKIDMPEGAFSALRMDPEGLAKELRLAAAVKWFGGERCTALFKD